MTARTRIFAAALLMVPTCLAGPRLHAQSDAALVRRPLASDTVIDDIPCGRTERAHAEFHADGRLHSCPLSRPIQLHGHGFPAGTWLQFDGAGRLWSAWLPADTRLGGHLCRGTGYKGWSVRFHPSGALAACFLAEVEHIERVWCQRGTFWNEMRGGLRSGASFRPDGRLARCQAARDFERDGVRVRKWQVVEIDSAGVLRVRS